MDSYLQKYIVLAVVFRCNLRIRLDKSYPWLLKLTLSLLKYEIGQLLVIPETEASHAVQTEIESGHGPVS